MNKQNERGSGTPESRFLIIGRIRKPHGVRGELKVAVLTDVPERFNWLETVVVTRKEGDDNNSLILSIESVRFHQQDALILFSGIESREAAGQLRNHWVKVPIEEALPLEEGEYYTHQAIGWAVLTSAGEQLGTVSGLIETGANDVFVVKTANGELLLPDIPDVIKTIDPTAGQLIVELMDGL